MQHLKHLTPMLLAALLAGAAHAQLHHPATGSPPAAATATSADMADGEIRKLDPDNQKVTIKHGEIKSLGMPGMTMVFRVRDPALLAQLKPGDKVRFQAEKANGAIVVTKIQPAE